VVRLPITPSGSQCVKLECTLATRHNPHIQALYQRLLARGKAKMAALGAAMRKLLQLAFGVLKHQQPYQANWTPTP